MARTNDPARMRDRILDAAFTAFTEAGYHATGMQALKEAAGVTSGAFAHHFPSKKALGLAVVDDKVRRSVTKTWIDPVLHAETAALGIDEVFRDIIASLDRNNAVKGCPLGNLAQELSGHDADLRHAMTALYDEWHSALAGKFETDSREGRAAPMPSDRLAGFVIAAYSGAMTLTKARQTTIPLRDCRAEIRRALGTYYTDS
ncbi:MAG: TetR/AcrR family transcriptional regulator [Alphaproteobacteria bacterium]